MFRELLPNDSYDVTLFQTSSTPSFKTDTSHLFVTSSPMSVTLPGLRHGTHRSYFTRPSFPSSVRWSGLVSAPDHPPETGVGLPPPSGPPKHPSFLLLKVVAGRLTIFLLIVTHPPPSPPSPSGHSVVS